MEEIQSQEEQRQSKLAERLASAIRAGSFSLVTEVLAEGFDLRRPLVTTGTRLYTALHIATAPGRAEICRALIAGGADPNAKMEDGWTPLMGAVSSGDTEVCEIILAAGADINASTTNGDTPLHISVNCNRPAIVRWVLEHGALVNAVNSDYSTPLHRTSYGKSSVFKSEMAEMLIASGADPAYVPENPPKNYRTPFQKAVSEGDMGAVRYYVEERGVDIGQRTLAGKSMGTVARERPEVRNYLLSLKTQREVLGAMKSASTGAEPDTRPSHGMAPL